MVAHALAGEDVLGGMPAAGGLEWRRGSQCMKHVRSTSGNSSIPRIAVMHRGGLGVQRIDSVVDTR